MNIDRLQLQRQVLLEVIERDKAFDMGAWLGFDYERVVSEKATDEPLPGGTVLVGPDGHTIKEIGCGTASCAFGWLCRDERGKTLGLSLHKKGPMYNDMEDSGEGFFDLPRETANWLFIPDYYQPLGTEDITPQHVIERIDWLIEGNNPVDFPWLYDEEK